MMATFRRIFRKNKLTILRYTVYIFVIGIITMYWPWPMDHRKKKGNKLSESLTFNVGDYPVNPDVDVKDQPANKRVGPKTLIREKLQKERKVMEEDLKDWHDRIAMLRDKAKQGIGENGQKVTHANQDHKCYTGFGYNSCTSNSISLSRSVADLRHPECSNKKYLRKLYKVSIIIPFYDEHRQTLLRSVHSLVNRSPPEILHEILLVDDTSKLVDLKSSFDAILKKEFRNVRVIRAQKREGLIRARLLGAREATGDVLLFLDSHIEVNYNWLPPLIDPIVRDWKTVTCPMIDVIDTDTFEYRRQDGGARGAFDWAFNYKRLPRLKEDLAERPADPFESPVMAGGLFAIHKDWFWKLGGYDPGLEVWGGEQYELSFKIWQCGGRMLDTPCSRVGHVFKKFSNSGAGSNLHKNYKRVADVWMDEYKQFIFNGLGMTDRLDSGDLTQQKALRKKLQCKSFKWFLTEVAFDLERYYPSVPPKPFAIGPIRNRGCDMCMSGKRSGQSIASLVKCNDDRPTMDQNIELSWKKEIKLAGRDWGCLDVPGAVGSHVIFFGCHGSGSTQRFKYNVDTHQIVHYGSGSCLQVSPDCTAIRSYRCVNSSVNQQWDFHSQNNTALRLLWTHIGHQLDVLT